MMTARDSSKSTTMADTGAVTGETETKRGGRGRRGKRGSRGSSQERGERESEVPGSSRGRASRSASESRGRSGSGGRGRGRGRGSGQGRGKEPRASMSDRKRVEERRSEAKEKMKDVVKEMDTEKLRELVLKLIEREPALVFDLCEGIDDGQPPVPPVPPVPASTPSWCKCGNCREMPTELERKCCGCLPRNCISAREQIENLVLDPEVLALGQRYHREMLGRYNQPIENYQKSMRHAAYRNFVLWRHGRLGAGVRRVIPSCCVWTIRDRYPSSLNQYTGFIPDRFI